jgi:AcrR family transcriptional regulator
MKSPGNLEDLLASAHFSPPQAKAYLAGLELGNGGLSDIAKRAGLSKTTAYEALEELCASKFARHTKRAGRVMYRMTDPEHVVVLLRNTASEQIAIIDDIVRVLPMFTALQGGDHPSTAVFEGADAIHGYFAHLERVRPKHIDEIVNSDDLYSWIDEKVLLDARKRYRWQPKTGRALSSGKRRNPNPLFVHRRLNPLWGSFRGNIAVYDSYVSLLTYTKRLTTIVIESKPLADSLRMLFEVAWRGSNDA